MARQMMFIGYCVIALHVLPAGCSKSGSCVVGERRAAVSLEGIELDWRDSFGRTMQRSEAFRTVCEQLDDYLRRPEVSSSRDLSVLVWRAAFRFGTPEQVATAFELCDAEINPAEFSVIPFDLASVDGEGLREWLLTRSGVTDAAVTRLLVRIAERAPDAWGPRDYTAVLERIMMGERSLGTRACAAFVLARWHGSCEDGQSARAFLEDAAKDDRVAESLLYSLDKELSPKP